MQPTPFRDAARAYIDRGWSGVLPLPARAKGAPPAGYTGAGGTDPSRADVQTWVDSRPESNVALRLPATVLALDVDAYGDKPGAATLARLEGELGPLPATVLSTSRSDGTSGIRLYRVPVRPNWSDAGPGLEVIHHAWRYVVVWPSIHPSGAVYRWIDQRTGEVLDGPPSPEDLPEAPSAWVEHLASDTSSPTKADADGDEVRAWLDQLPAGEPCHATTREVRRFTEQLTSGTSRHDATLRPVGALVRAGERGHLGVRDALSEARTAFLDAVTRPGEGQRTQRVAEAEWRRGVAGAYGLVKADPTPEADHGCRCLTAVEEPEVSEAAVQSIAERYPTLDWRALWDAELDEPDWLIDQLLMRRRAGALFAPGKTGKSLVLLEAIGCVVTGQPFADLEVQQAPVLYVDRENDPGDIIGRLKTFGFTPDDLDELHYLSYPELPGLDDPRGGAELLELARHYGAELVVLDTLARTVHGPENDADTYRDYAIRTGAPLKAAGIAVVRIDHAGKDVLKGQRGSAAKADDVDVVWQLRRGGDDVQRWTWSVWDHRKRYREGLNELRLHRGGDGRLHQPGSGDPFITVVGSETRIAELIAAMNELKMPHEWGWKNRAKALRSAGVAVSTPDVQEATRRIKSGDLAADLTPAAEVPCEVPPGMSEYGDLSPQRSPSVPGPPGIGEGDPDPSAP